MARLYVLVYPFAMKYVLIFIAVIVLVRIDVVVNLIEKAYDKISQKSAVEVDTREIKTSRELIPISEDQNLKQDDHSRILALIESFQLSPYPEIRKKIMEELRAHPQAFSVVTLDKTLESHLLGFRDLLSRADAETLSLLVELHDFMKGDNLGTVKRVFSYAVDFNLPAFLKYYSQTKDSLCNPILLFADNVPPEEKVNEYFDRDKALTEYLTQEKVDPASKTLATTCQLVLKSELAKLAPAPTPAVEPNEAAPAPEASENVTLPPPTGTP